jgi:hypothetical protein
MVPFAPMESVEDSVPEEYDQQYQQLELQELAESQLMKERRIRFANSKRKIDPSQLITPPGIIGQICTTSSLRWFISGKKENLQNSSSLPYPLS